MVKHEEIKSQGIEKNEKNKKHIVYRNYAEQEYREYAS